MGAHKFTCCCFATCSLSLLACFLKASMFLQPLFRWRAENSDQTQNDDRLVKKWGSLWNLKLYGSETPKANLCSFHIFLVIFNWVGLWHCWGATLFVGSGCVLTGVWFAWIYDRWWILIEISWLCANSHHFLFFFSGHKTKNSFWIIVYQCFSFKHTKLKFQNLTCNECHLMSINKDISNVVTSHKDVGAIVRSLYLNMNKLEIIIAPHHKWY